MSNVHPVKQNTMKICLQLYFQNYNLTQKWLSNSANSQPILMIGLSICCSWNVWFKHRNRFAIFCQRKCFMQSLKSGKKSRSISAIAILKQNSFYQFKILKNKWLFTNDVITEGGGGGGSMKNTLWHWALAKMTTSKVNFILTCKSNLFKLRVNRPGRNVKFVIFWTPI